MPCGLYRDLPAHQPWQPQVTGGAELLVLPIQVATLLVGRFSYLTEDPLQLWRRKQKRQRREISA